MRNRLHSASSARPCVTPTSSKRNGLLEMDCNPVPSRKAALLPSYMAAIHLSSTPTLLPSSEPQARLTAMAPVSCSTHSTKSTDGGETEPSEPQIPKADPQLGTTATGTRGRITDLPRQTFPLSC